MKALVTGADGQLGRELAPMLPGARLLGHVALDVTIEAQVWDVIARCMPQVVFHCAAMTDVDGCEQRPAQARMVNTLGTRYVASVCGALGIHLVAVSTDYVFDGASGRPNGEDTEPRPVSVYGRTKLEAEQAIRESGGSYAIVRTSWLYGGSNRNFVRTVLRRAVAGEALRMVEREVSNPTWARDLATGLVQLGRLRAVGTFHLANEGHASRLEWARAIVSLAGLDPSLVQPTASYPLPAKRPQCSALKNTRAARLGVTLRPWREALQDFMSFDAEILDMIAGREAGAAR